MKVKHLNDCTCCDRHVACATNAGGTDILTTKDLSEVTCRRCPGTVRYSRYRRNVEYAARAAEHAPQVGSTWVVNGEVRSTITRVHRDGSIEANSDDHTGYERGRYWFLDSWIHGRSLGWIIPASPDTAPVPPVPRFTLVRQDYGVAVKRSAERFKVTGKGAYNPHHDHHIVVFAGKCCDVRVVHMHMNHLPIVIAAGQVPVSPVPVEVGAVLDIDDTEYRLLARKFSDPILVPVGWEEYA